MNLFILLLCNFGLAWIVTRSYLFEDIRIIIEALDEYIALKLPRLGIITDKISYLFGCILCTGVWTMALLMKLSTLSSLDHHFILIDYIIYPFLSIPINLLIIRYADYLQSKTKKSTL